MHVVFYLCSLLVKLSFLSHALRFLISQGGRKEDIKVELIQVNTTIILDKIR